MRRAERGVHSCADTYVVFITSGHVSFLITSTVSVHLTLKTRCQNCMQKRDRDTIRRHWRTTVCRRALRNKIWRSGVQFFAYSHSHSSKRRGTVLSARSFAARTNLATTNGTSSRISRRPVGCSRNRSAKAVLTRSSRKTRNALSWQGPLALCNSRRTSRRACRSRSVLPRGWQNSQAIMCSAHERTSTFQLVQATVVITT